jgi:hypothetical protein
MGHLGWANVFNCFWNYLAARPLRKSMAATGTGILAIVAKKHRNAAARSNQRVG